jgi:hypothetical protein
VPTPWVSDGSSRADGYTVPSSFSSAGPSAPADGCRSPAASRASREPGRQTTSGFATTSQGAVAPAAPAFAPAP